MRNKKLIFLVFAVSGIALTFLMLAGWFAYRLFTGSLFGLDTPATPAELRQPRVTVARLPLARTEFAVVERGQSPIGSFSAIGSIDDLAVGELNAAPGSDVVVAGRHGAMFLDANGTKRAQIAYVFETEEQRLGPFRHTNAKSLLGEIEIIDVEQDGVCEFLARGGLDGAALFDHGGGRRWSYGEFTEEKTSIDDMAAGDVDGNGRAEFVALWDGVELFDRRMRRLWRRPVEGARYQSEIVDTDGDGRNEIVQSSGGELVVRDARGEIVRAVEMPFYFSQFALCAPPEEGARQQILAVEDGNLWLTDLSGKAVSRFDAPLSEFDDAANRMPDGTTYGTSAYTAEGVWVRLISDRRAYLAVVTEFAALDRSVLYIYEANGVLVYQEVLPESSRAVAALPRRDEGNLHDLLVGGEGTVWRFSPR